MELQELLQTAVVNFSLLKLLVGLCSDIVLKILLLLIIIHVRFEEELKTAIKIWRERE